MKKYNVVLKENVYEKLEEILDYNLRNTFDLNFSKKIIDEIILTMNSLDIFPYRCPLYWENFRVFIYKKYKFFYKVDEENKIVEIYYLFWVSENYDSFFKKYF